MGRYTFEKKAKYRKEASVGTQAGKLTKRKTDLAGSARNQVDNPRAGNDTSPQQQPSFINKQNEPGATQDIILEAIRGSNISADVFNLEAEEQEARVMHEECQTIIPSVEHTGEIATTLENKSGVFSMESDVLTQLGAGTDLQSFPELSLCCDITPSEQNLVLTESCGSDVVSTPLSQHSNVSDLQVLDQYICQDSSSFFPLCEQGALNADLANQDAALSNEGLSLDTISCPTNTNSNEGIPLDKMGTSVAKEDEPETLAQGFLSDHPSSNSTCLSQRSEDNKLENPFSPIGGVIVKVSTPANSKNQSELRVKSFTPTSSVIGSAEEIPFHSDGVSAQASQSDVTQKEADSVGTLAGIYPCSKFFVPVDIQANVVSDFVGVQTQIAVHQGFASNTPFAAHAASHSEVPNNTFNMFKGNMEQSEAVEVKTGDTNAEKEFQEVLQTSTYNPGFHNVLTKVLQQQSPSAAVRCEIGFPPSTTEAELDLICDQIHHLCSTFESQDLSMESLNNTCWQSYHKYKVGNTFVFSWTYLPFSFQTILL